MSVAVVSNLTWFCTGFAIAIWLATIRHRVHRTSRDYVDEFIKGLPQHKNFSPTPRDVEDAVNELKAKGGV